MQPGLVRLIYSIALLSVVQCYIGLCSRHWVPFPWDSVWTGLCQTPVIVCHSHTISILQRQKYLQAPNQKPGRARSWGLCVLLILKPQWQQLWPLFLRWSLQWTGRCISEEIISVHQSQPVIITNLPKSMKYKWVWDVRSACQMILDYCSELPLWTQYYWAVSRTLTASFIKC